MITEFEKEKIIIFSQKNLNLAKSILYLRSEKINYSGRGCRRYGFPRMKNLMKELKNLLI